VCEARSSSFINRWLRMFHVMRTSITFPIAHFTPTFGKGHSFGTFDHEVGMIALTQDLERASEEAQTGIDASAFSSHLTRCEASRSFRAHTERTHHTHTYLAMAQLKWVPLAYTHIRGPFQGSLLVVQGRLPPRSRR